MKKLIKIEQIDKNPHRDLERYPPNPDQVKKLIESIHRTGFWNNLVVRPHPEQEGRYQLAYGHNRIEACRKAGVLDAELSVMDLSNYDMHCCMVDENLTQQHVSPKTVFEIVSSAILLAEKMLRESKNVADFNTKFERSKGITLWMQKSVPMAPSGRILNWAPEEYTRAKTAIEPCGNGLGREFIRHFLPTGAIPNENTLQGAITGYYHERWRREGEDLLEQSRMLLWQGMNSDPPDPEKIAQAHELEKQGKVLLGKVKDEIISRDLLEQLDSIAKMGDVVRLVKRCKIPPAFHAELVRLSMGWAADSSTSQQLGTSIYVQGESWWDVASGNYAKRMQDIKDRLKEQALRDKLGTEPLPTVISNLLIDIGRTSNDMDEPLEQLKLASEYFSTLEPKELRGFRERMGRIHHSILGQANVLLLLLRHMDTVRRAQERELNPSLTPLQLESQ